MRAELFLAQGPTALAVPNALHGRRQRLGQAQAATAVTLQQLQRHALCRFLAHTGQDAQGVDQLADQRAEAHGSIPEGCCIARREGRPGGVQDKAPTDEEPECAAAHEDSESGGNAVKRVDWASRVLCGCPGPIATQ
ncbi:hypothetical protein FQZ97_1069910 [compost metagenome]